MDENENKNELVNVTKSEFAEDIIFWICNKGTGDIEKMADEKAKSLLFGVGSSKPEEKVITFQVEKLSEFSKPIKIDSLIIVDENGYYYQTTEDKTNS